jgi:hypothetical protein
LSNQGKALKVSLNCKFREYNADLITGQGGYRVILIQEGLGNLHDCYYYSKDALKYAAENKIFEGAKIYADHPSIIDEQSRPERSVKDIIGHFENVQLEMEADRAMLTGVVRIPLGNPFDWVRSMMDHAVSFAKKYSEDGMDFIGLSINANGDAFEQPIDDVIRMAPTACREKLLKAKSLGIPTVKVTKAIFDAFSCDMVTSAGAGGRVLKLLQEGDKAMAEQAPIPAPAQTAPVPAAIAKTDDKAAPAHDDQAQDIELIKNMLKKYLGDSVDDAQSEEAKKISGHYKQMGHTEEEAAELAGKHLMVSKAMKSDEAPKAGEEKPAVANEEEGQKVPTDPKEGEEPKLDGDKKEGEENFDNKKDISEGEESEEGKPPFMKKKEGEEKKEDEVKESAKLVAKIASLEEKLFKYELKEHSESVLSKSKLPQRVTKVFKENLGKTIKNKHDFDKAYNLFLEAFKDGGEASSFVEGEKIVPNGEVKKVISFSSLK